jgi:hypothetical protein
MLLAVQVRDAMLPLPAHIAQIEVASPGFLNVFLSPAEVLRAELERDEGLEGLPPRLLQRGAGTLRMAAQRGLWPLPGAQVAEHRLVLPQEQALLRQLRLASSDAHWVRTTERLFDAFHARVAVLAMEPELAQARLALLVATLRRLARAHRTPAVKDFTHASSNDPKPHEASGCGQSTTGGTPG